MPESMRLVLRYREKRRLRLRHVGYMALIALLVSLAYAAAVNHTGGYAITDARGFEEAVAGNDAVAVMFSSSSCPVCRSMEPYWRRLVEAREVGIRFLIVYYTPRTAPLYSRLGITETPTFILFYDGKPVARYVGEFRGRNITQAMLDWATKSLLEPDTGVSSYSNSTCVGAACKIAAPEPKSGEPFFLAISLLTGFLATLSPCTLPLFLAYAGSVQGSRRRGKGTLCGCFAAALLGVVAAGLIFLIAASAVSMLQGGVTVFAAALLLQLGAAQVLGYSFSAPSFSGFRGLGVAGSCGLFSILSLQCNMPLVLAPFLIALGAGGGGLLEGLAVVIGYAVGLGVTLTLILAGVERVRGVVGRLLAREKVVTRIGGVALIASAVAMLYYLVSPGL